ncbi:hypothetical protein [Kineococcus radiotolerans]|uniref:Uncharacterized protein n=1 Tax=Kineococcus radiotolerans (strain ATCC BAA-149 / DSM 14245 / SRS30216) TaxID=266940 RepID=A6W4S0_KINRD|nr:hypothetical protein [Kineococcus radiotolerans]ABS01809.1 hypothetical protein Krad_0319 [Kineococcus radiotolerans SRS30216 = ATCC BAA-149]
MPNRPATAGTSPVRGALRCARAGAVATTVVGLAAGAHLAAGGRAPGIPLLLAVAVVVGALSLLLAGRRFSRSGLAGLLGGGQVTLHELFDACPAQAVAVVAHGHHLEWTPLTGAVDGAAGSAGSGSAAMTLAHVAATVAALLLLLHGERLLWSLWAWLRPLARVLRDLLRFVAARPAPFPATPPARPRSVVARRVRRRGPPVGSAPVPTS